MEAFKFSCGHCGQHLTATPDQVGDSAPCPGCGIQVTVPPVHSNVESSFPAIPSPASVQVESVDQTQARLSVVAWRYKEAKLKLVVFTSCLFILISAIAIPAGVLLWGYFRSVSDTASIQASKVRLNATLEPLVESLRPRLTSNYPESPKVPLKPPFVVYYLGDSPHSPIAGQRGVLFGLPKGAEPNTLIVVRDAILDTKVYSIQRGPLFLDQEPVQTFYRHRHHLWAIDLRSKAVVAYNHVVDPGMELVRNIYTGRDGVIPPTATNDLHPYMDWGNELTGKSFKKGP